MTPRSPVFVFRYGFPGTFWSWCTKPEAGSEFWLPEKDFVNDNECQFLKKEKSWPWGEKSFTHLDGVCLPHFGQRQQFSPCSSWCWKYDVKQPSWKSRTQGPQVNRAGRQTFHLDWFQGISTFSESDDVIIRNFFLIKTLTTVFVAMLESSFYREAINSIYSTWLWH